MDPITGAVIAGGAQSIGSGLTSVINTNKTIKAQRKLAEYAYTKDLEMWNKANEYNSPAAQMQRLSQAGLNPHLVYGNGSVVGNTTTQTPKYQMYSPEYKYEAPKVAESLSMLGMYQDYQNKKAQNEGIILDNANKAISNEYLSENLKYRNYDLQHKTGISQQKEQQEVLNTLLSSQTYADRAKIPGRQLSQYDATTRLALLNADARAIENKLLNLGVRGSDNILLRMLIQNTKIPDRLKSLFGK